MEASSRRELARYFQRQVKIGPNALHRLPWLPKIPCEIGMLRQLCFR